MSAFGNSSDINDRIKFIQDYYGLKQKEFAHKVGVTPGAISKINKHLSMPSGDLLWNILNEFTDISAEWLMRGSGSIKKSYSQQINTPTITQTQYQELLQRFEKLSNDFDKFKNE